MAEAVLKLFPFDWHANIATWELPQFCLFWMVNRMIPAPGISRTFPQLCDNAGAEAVAHKGLSSSSALQWLLARYFCWQRRNHICVDIAHIAGHENTVADGLSRFVDPTQLNLQPEHEVVTWRSLCSSASLHLKTSSGKWPTSFAP